VTIKKTLLSSGTVLTVGSAAVMIAVPPDFSCPAAIHCQVAIQHDLPHGPEREPRPVQTVEPIRPVQTVEPITVVSSVAASSMTMPLLTQNIVSRPLRSRFDGWLDGEGPD
jgi:hypothetical protein